jgi:hypothetical protein
MGSLDLNKRRPSFFYFDVPLNFESLNIFLPVNASLHWLNNVSCQCLFLSFPLITSGVNSAVIKVDWLAA